MDTLPRKDRTAALNYEYQQWELGYRSIAGVDEAGRGPWAGPVAAALVVLPLDNPDLETLLHGAKDSKEMTARQRTALADTIKNTAMAWGIGFADVSEIAALGIAPAIKLAYARALHRAEIVPDFLLIDHMKWTESNLPQLNLTRGDQLSLSIACASILAKTWRDEQMQALSRHYPHYGFDKHKGYGTPQHRAAIERHGVLAGVHRDTFAPIIALREAQA
jgi:ribonuclease HII